jgi:kinesin family protein 6/9
MLKDSLGGNCKTTMVACVWPEANKIEETASTLRFATRMMKVSNEATVNVHLDPQMLIRKYERQIKDLKQELAMHDTLAGRSRVQYEEYTPDEQSMLDEKVKQYLDCEIQEIEVQSLRMVYEAFAIFRKYHQNLTKELSQRPETLPAAAFDEVMGGDAAGQGADQAEQREGEVGMDEEGKGISVGVAPSNLRPRVEDPVGGLAGEVGDDVDGGPTQTIAPKQAASDEKAPDKQVVFLDWKAKEGAVYEAEFEQNRQELRKSRADAKEALAVANSKKRTMDEIKERLERKKAERAPEIETVNDDEPIIVDEEEYALIDNLKAIKAECSEAFKTYRNFKNDVVPNMENMLQRCKVKLVQAFEEWHDQKYGHLSAATTSMPFEREKTGERYDPQEQFDLMEAERLETQHPDALAYHKARKNAARDVRQKGMTKTKVR